MGTKCQKYFDQERESFAATVVRRVKGQRPIPRFPPRAQIQTRTACNGRCAFCPNTSVGGHLSPGTMDWDLFRKIADELCSQEMDEIHVFLMNEPLLDKELPEKIRYIAERKQRCTKTKINTNGSLLTGDMAERLIDSGLDKINVSFHGVRPEVYEFNMGNLKYEHVLKNVLRFKEMLAARNGKKPGLRITMVKTKDIVAEQEEIKAFWAKYDIGCNIRPIGNRNNKNVEMQGINWEKWRPYTWCRRLFTQMYILYNGDCVLCCCDWNRTTILGNLRRSTIEEVWNGPAYRRARDLFLHHDMKGLLCETCLYTR